MPRSPEHKSKADAVRVFVALDIPEQVRAAIGKWMDKLKVTCESARWVRVPSMHVTLKFIGEAQPELVEQIQARLATIRLAEEVEMTFRDAGFFPNEHRPRVFWVGIAASSNLSELAAGVERQLEPLGIPREQRPFRPHLTLARFQSQDRLEKLREAVRNSGPPEFGSTRTGELHLYRSQLKPGGAEYTRIATFFLLPARETRP